MGKSVIPAKNAILNRASITSAPHTTAPPWEGSSSPDWSAKEEPVPCAKLDNPQSLNLYSYVLNNPLSKVDTDGHACGGLYLTRQRILYESA